MQPSFPALVLKYCKEPGRWNADTVPSALELSSDNPLSSPSHWHLFQRFLFRLYCFLCKKKQIISVEGTVSLSSTEPVHQVDGKADFLLRIRWCCFALKGASPCYGRASEV